LLLQRLPYRFCWVLFENIRVQVEVWRFQRVLSQWLHAGLYQHYAQVWRVYRSTVSPELHEFYVLDRYRVWTIKIKVGCVSINVTSIHCVYHLCLKHSMIWASRFVVNTSCSSHRELIYLKIWIFRTTMFYRYNYKILLDTSCR